MTNNYTKFIVGVYAVIQNQNDELLILSLPTSKKFPNEAWMLPGGRLENQENPEDTLIREIKEETNLEINVVSPCHVAIWMSDGEPKCSIFYHCQTKHNQVKLSDEHNAYKWISVEKIDSIPFHNNNSKIAIQKITSRLLGCKVVRL